MKYKFIKYIKEQLNIELKNDRNNIFNNKRKILYCEIKKEEKNNFLSFLEKHNFKYEHHIGYNYWVWVINY